VTAITNAIRVDGREIEIGHADKILFPDDGITKADLCMYYRRVAVVSLPHYRDRALTMHRYPDGIGEAGFFQKSVPDYFPGWIETTTLGKEGGTITQVIANDAATLVYLANQGCITPHLSLFRTGDWAHPDRLVFDLDPSDDDFGKVRRTAKRLKDLLDELGLACFVQTTGSRGVHVVVPLRRDTGFDQARGFAKRTGEVLETRYPEEVTLALRKKRRGRHVFIDYLRNAYGQTTVAPYAVRARPGAPVATPITWNELASADLGPRTYTLSNLFRRLGQRDDPWTDLDKKAHSLKSAATELEKICIRGGLGRDS